MYKLILCFQMIGKPNNKNNTHANIHILIDQIFFSNIKKYSLWKYSNIIYYLILLQINWNSKKSGATGYTNKI